MISNDSIDLFRHCAIIAPQSCLDMCDFDARNLRCSESSGENSIGISLDEDNIRLFIQEDFLHFDEHSSGHVSMSSAIDPEIVFCFFDPELLKKYRIHIPRIMLIRMDDEILYPSFFSSPHGGVELDDLRACSEDKAEFHSLRQCNENNTRNQENRSDKSCFDIFFMKYEISYKNTEYHTHALHGNNISYHFNRNCLHLKDECHCSDSS